MAVTLRTVFVVVSVLAVTPLWAQGPALPALAGGGSAAPLGGAVETFGALGGPSAMPNGDGAGLPGLGDGGMGGDSPLGDVLTIEQEDDQLLLGLRLDGRDGVLDEDFVPFASVNAALSPDGIATDVYAEESDDWLLLQVLLSPERSFLDIEGEGDERIDTETDRDLFGLLN